MTYAETIRHQAETAPLAALPAVVSALWKAFAEGHVLEAEAEVLSALIDARRKAQKAAPQLQGPPDRQGRPRTGVGSRPRTDASLERRRRWAASGRLPPAIAARFTLAEQAALSLVAAETARRGDCRLAIEHVAALAGVSRSTVKNAIREARKLGIISVEERRVTGFRNLPNIVRVIDRGWVAWLRLSRRETFPAERGVGVKFPTGTPTQVSKQGKSRTEGPSRRSTTGPNPTPGKGTRVIDAGPRRGAAKG